MKIELDAMREWIKMRFEVVDDWDCQLLALDLLDYLDRNNWGVRWRRPLHTIAPLIPGTYEDCLRSRKQSGAPLTEPGAASTNAAFEEDLAKINERIRKWFENEGYMALFSAMQRSTKHPPSQEQEQNKDQ